MIGIILAAGASTRMKTKVSKLLQPVLGKPVIAWAMEQAALVCNEIVVVVGHQRDLIEKAAREAVPASIKLHFVEQSNPKGTADAVKRTLPLIQSRGTEMVFIMGADAFLLKPESLKSWIDETKAKKAVLALLTFRCFHPHAYGRLIRNAQGAPVRIVEAKDATEQEKSINEVNSGFYLCQVSVLQEALLQIKSNNKSEEFYLTDIVESCRDKSLLIHALEISEDEAAGANTLEELVEVERIAQKRILSAWMAKGVRFLNPELTRVESTVILHPDIIVSGGVQLLGKTELKSGVTVGPYALITNSIVGENSKIEAMSIITDSKLGNNVTVGPFARLRPGSDLADEVHIGNFVEIKKSKLAKGVKAGHLSYLGDAEIGAETNIGAGTITCNYDGFNKNKTVIAEEVFIGSNTSLVAPVTIGPGAIVGAGSVIVEDIKQDELSFERSSQIHKAEGAKRFRQKNKKN